MPRTESVEVHPPGGVGGDGPERWTPTEVTGPPPAGPVTASDRLWWAAAVLLRRRWSIIALTALAAAGAVALALSIPNRYRAEARVFLPAGGDGLSGILGSIAPDAAALFGKSSGDYTRYMAILTSRTMMESAVDRFGLVEVYELEEAAAPRSAAVRELYENAEFTVSLDFDYLSVGVLDESPRRSAQMSNYFVDQLNRENIRLTSSSAESNRMFLEARLNQAKAALDSAQVGLQAVQERSGILQPESQATALMESLARAQGVVATGEVQYQSLLTLYGDSGNPDVLAAKAALDVARSQVDRLRNGGEAVMPVPMADLPTVQRQYSQAMQDVLVQTQIVTVVQPLYEQAVLSERREADAVQVLDPAVPPSKKAEPKRSVLVVVLTVSALLLVVALFLVSAWFRAHAGAISARLRAAQG